MDPLNRLGLLRLATVAAAAFLATGASGRTPPRPFAQPQQQPQQQARAGDYDSLAEQTRWEEVMDLAERRLEAAPGDVAAVAWLGRASFEKAMGLSAGDDFSRDLGRALLERAVAALGRAVAQGGESLPAAAKEWWYAARLEAGEDKALVPELEAAWTEKGHAYAAFLRGWMAWEELADPERSGGVSRAPDQAVLSWLRYASDAQPSRATFSLVLAEALAASGDRAGASAAWERAYAGDADSGALLGTLLSIFPGPDQAVSRLERLQRLTDREDAASATLAWAEAHALDQLGRAEDAERAFARVAAAERNSGFDRAHAQLLVRLDRHAEAVLLMQPRAAQRDWEAFTVLLDIADGLGLARRWDESLTAYDVAIAIEHRDERAARNRAITLWRAGQTEQARAAWDDVIALLPARADILNDAALAAAGAGDAAAERALLEAAVALPGSEDSRENLAAWHLEHASDPREEAVRLLDMVLAVEPDRDRALYLRFKAGRAR